MHRAWPIPPVALLLTLPLAVPGCDDAPGADTVAPATAPLLPVTPPPAPGCGTEGKVLGTIYGDVRVDLDWRSPQLACEGMPRPNGAGARLRFSGQAADADLALIVAIPGLRRGVKAVELESNVTLIEEGNGRFFSTSDLESCWTDVLSQSPDDGDTDVVVIEGVLYCIAPLGEVNGSSSLEIQELEFSGLLDWGDS